MMATVGGLKIVFMRRWAAEDGKSQIADKFVMFLTFSLAVRLARLLLGS